MYLYCEHAKHTHTHTHTHTHRSSKSPDIGSKAFRISKWLTAFFSLSLLVMFTSCQEDPLQEAIFNSSMDSVKTSKLQSDHDTVVLDRFIILTTEYAQAVQNEGTSAKGLVTLSENGTNEEISLYAESVWGLTSYSSADRASIIGDITGRFTVDSEDFEALITNRIETLDERGVINSLGTFGIDDDGSQSLSCASAALLGVAKAGLTIAGGCLAGPFGCAFGAVLAGIEIFETADYLVNNC